MGKNKSETACKAVQKMNQSFNFKSLQLLVNPQNETYFNDEFWDGLDCAVNAVDNVKVSNLSRQDFM